MTAGFDLARESANRPVVASPSLIRLAPFVLGHRAGDAVRFVRQRRLRFLEGRSWHEGDFALLFEYCGAREEGIAAGVT